MLRELHGALEQQLRATFPEAQVRKHAGEVDIETVRRHALQRVNLWVTVAHGEGLEISEDTQLRVMVEWAVFIIAGAAFEGEQGERRRVEPVEVAETYARDVLRLAYDNDWGLEPCARARRTDLRFRNLGVGLKPTARGVDKADLGLFVVWGRQELELGENLLPGKAELPRFSGFDGGLHDRASGAAAGVELDFEAPAPSALLALAAGNFLRHVGRGLRTRMKRAA